MCCEICHFSNFALLIKLTRETWNGTISLLTYWFYVKRYEREQERSSHIVQGSVIPTCTHSNHMLCHLMYTETEPWHMDSKLLKNSLPVLFSHNIRAPADFYSCLANVFIWIMLTFVFCRLKQHVLCTLCVLCLFLFILVIFKVFFYNKLIMHL